MLEIVRPDPLLTAADITAIELATRRCLNGTLYCSVCGVSVPFHTDECPVNKLYRLKGEAYA